MGDAGIDFTPQLESYKADLLSRYHERNRVISERELLLFKYKVVWLFKFKNSLDEIQYEIMKSQNQNSATFAISFLATLLSNFIPMASITDAYVSKDILNTQLPFQAASPSFGQLYDSEGLAHIYGGLTSTDFLLTAMTGSSKFYRNLKGIAAVSNPNQVIAESYTDLDKLIYDMATRLLVDVSSQDFLIVKNAVFKVYASGNFRDIYAEGKILYSQIVVKTSDLLNLQFNLDSIEEDVKNFIISYQQQGGLTNVQASDIFNQLMTLSKASAANSLLKAPLVKAGSTNAESPATTPKAFDKPKSNTLLYVAGALGLYLATKE